MNDNNQSNYPADPIGHPLLKELTEQHPYTIDTLRGISEDLGLPYVFLVHEICDAWLFARQADKAGK